MRSVADYRRFARQSRRLAAALSGPADKRALELMAKAWDKTAEKCEKLREEQQKQLEEADSDH
jgi:hypothetical protein